MLRSDFVELQRQEQELKMTSDFMRDEINANKDDKAQKRITTAHTVNAHQRMCKAIREQRIDLNEIDDFLREVNTDGFFSTLQFNQSTQCETCSSSKLSMRILT